jgi:hypothetical protein
MGEKVEIVFIMEKTVYIRVILELYHRFGTHIDSFLRHNVCEPHQ